MTAPPGYIMGRPAPPFVMPQDVIDLIQQGWPGIAAETLSKRYQISLSAAESRIHKWFWDTFEASGHKEDLSSKPKG